MFFKKRKKAEAYVLKIRGFALEEFVPSVKQIERSLTAIVA
jgi:hypothetical protein